MTDKPRDGGPAFAHGKPEHGGDPGMSNRDYFAGQAVAGLLTDREWRATDIDVARAAYAIADAMLKARNAA